jgi:hypothetical protein
MMHVLRQGHLNEFPFEAYCCCWMAFNNIYAKLSEGSVHSPSLTGRNHRPVGGVVVPQVHNGSERGQIAVAVRRLPPQLKHRLILSEHAEYFVLRTPKLRGEPKPVDLLGQPLNGVLNVGHTLATGQLIWQPIDRTGFQQYKNGDRNKRLRRSLARQIVLVLYSVRNNLFHGGKIRNNDNDEEVIEHALPLLKQLVDTYIAQPV